jgi:hypothetical protein
MLVSIHDDDQLIACNDRSALNALKERLNAQFECTDNGPVNPLLRFNVIRGRQARRLDISQEYYVKALLERFDMMLQPNIKTSVKVEDSSTNRTLLLPTRHPLSTKYRVPRIYIP